MCITFNYTYFLLIIKIEKYSYLHFRDSRVYVTGTAPVSYAAKDCELGICEL